MNISVTLSAERDRVLAHIRSAVLDLHNMMRMNCLATADKTTRQDRHAVNISSSLKRCSHIMMITSVYQRQARIFEEKCCAVLASLNASPKLRADALYSSHETKES
jgi:hypothetical protein